MGYLRLLFANGDTQMKTLAVIVALTVGGIHVGCGLFDRTLETAKQSQTASLVKARQNITF